MPPRPEKQKHRKNHPPVQEPASPEPFTPLPPSKRITAGILAALCLFGACLRLAHLNDVTSRTPDENVYTYYGQRIAANGLSGLPVLIDQYNRDRKLWIYPPPMRAGYLVMLAAFMKIGPADVRAGVWLSWLSSVASLALLAVIGARFLPPWVAIYAVLNLAVSLYDLVIARRCWQDSVVGALGLVLIWAACEIARDHEKWWPYAVLIGGGSLSACVKELGALVYIACVFYVLVILYQRRAWKNLAWMVGAGLAGAVLSFCSLATASGGVTSLLTGWSHMRESVKDNPYAWEFQNLPWYQFVRGFWILSPLNLLLAAFAVGLSVVPGRQWTAWPLPPCPADLSLLRLFSWMTVSLVLLILSVPTLENFRYLSPVYGPMYLLGGIGLWSILETAAAKMGRLGYRIAAIAALALVLTAALSQYQHFEQAYVTEAAPDLSIKLVIETRE